MSGLAYKINWYSQISKITEHIGAKFRQLYRKSALESKSLTSDFAPEVTKYLPPPPQKKNNWPKMGISITKRVCEPAYTLALSSDAACFFFRTATSDVMRWSRARKVGMGLFCAILSQIEGLWMPSRKRFLDILLEFYAILRVF